MDTNRLDDLGEEVYAIAATIFENCGAADDFCHQSGLVFGGTNRIKLTIYGWRADESYCTKRFLAEFNRRYETGFGPSVTKPGA